MAHNYCCGQFNDAFQPKRLGNWCEHTHPHKKLCSPRVCQFRPQGHLDFIADDRGHLLPAIRKNIRMKANHWGYPILRVWDEDFGCSCLRPRPPKKFPKEPYKAKDLPTAEHVVKKQKKPKDEPVPQEPIREVNPIEPAAPEPAAAEPKKPTDLAKKIEFLIALDNSQPSSSSTRPQTAKSGNTELTEFEDDDSDSNSLPDESDETSEVTLKKQNEISLYPVHVDFERQWQRIKYSIRHPKSVSTVRQSPFITKLKEEWAVLREFGKPKLAKQMQNPDDNNNA